MRSNSSKEAEKLAKRKLHQAFGAFLDPAARRRALQLLACASTEVAEVRWSGLLDEVVTLHASTSERSGSEAALWALIREVAGEVRSVLDLGCGLAPAALPRTGLARDVAYLGIDLDLELCAALQGALRPRFPEVRVAPGEVRSGGPWPRAEVAILCKLLPTLERQEPGAAEALVSSLDAGLVVATFPTRSLGGRDRGMEDRYAALAERWLPGGRTVRLGDELVRLSR